MSEKRMIPLKCDNPDCDNHDVYRCDATTPEAAVEVRTETCPECEEDWDEYAHPPVFYDQHGQPVS